MTLDMPDDFALDQPLSPFLLAALELLDPESDTYALDVISMAEATLEDPKQVLRAPVSYTHLDVYKRQTSTCPDCG